MMLNSLLRLFNSDETNNYKIFFPLAIPGFSAGLGLWLFSTDYAFQRVWHPLLMIHSLLFPVVVGFLWTGIPRFIATEYPAKPFKILYFFLILASFFSFMLQSVFLFKLFMFLSHAGLAVWLVMAFKKKKVSPPQVLAFLAFAGIAGTAGTGLIFLSELMQLPGILMLLGDNLHRYVFFILIITSVGSRMMPVMHSKQIPQKPVLSIHSLKISKHPHFWYYTAAVIFLILSLPDEIAPAAPILRFLAIFFIMKEIWHFFAPSKNHNLATLFTFLAQFFLLLSPIVILSGQLAPAPSRHFFFIAFLFLLVIVISARVILAHGGYGLDKEVRSYFFLIAYFLIIIGMFVRIFSDFLFQFFNPYHASAGILFLAFILWLTEILRSVISGKKVE